MLFICLFLLWKIAIETFQPQKKSVIVFFFFYCLLLLLLPREPPSNEGRPSIRVLFVFGISSPRQETKRVSLASIDSLLSRFFHFDFCWLARSHKECLYEIRKRTFRNAVKENRTGFLLIQIKYAKNKKKGRAP
jgi:hypothetical protein